MAFYGSKFQPVFLNVFKKELLKLWKNYSQTTWSYISSVYTGLQKAFAANLRKLGWNPVLPELFHFRPFLVCNALQLDCIKRMSICPSNTGFSSFQLNELLFYIPPKISSWVCYTANRPFPTILEDDNVTCHSRSREDNGLNSTSTQRRMSYPLTPFMIPDWERTTAFSTFWLQLPLQCELGQKDGISAHHKLNCRWSWHPTKSQVHCSREAVRLILWLRQMVLQWLESECNFKFCSQWRELWFLFSGLEKRAFWCDCMSQGSMALNTYTLSSCFNPVLGVQLNPAASKLSLKNWDELVWTIHLLKNFNK